MLEKINHAQGQVLNGDREGAQRLYLEMWDEALRTEDQYQACVVAHFMAHACTEPGEQLLWHQRALKAAEAVGDESVQGFFPSLYANLGEVCLRLGDREQARVYATRAQEVAHLLQDDGYGRMIVSLIERVLQATE
ncbi:hypothetical protein KSC_008390 [Ktedonobacter sp. SOSP1-52]|uniref:hypothetical protein n=1 Tax=Ktedonobacter sp. SOSP1-52 TaxID=2778366 RepID=UPI0019166160|nr:hypothetical protein [Ktedonobacter sp. SOSP1-52]GHO61947.1 hypothetical protein KSC_008390 [Ktedonobacter sp. SOSP1-52]